MTEDTHNLLALVDRVVAPVTARLDSIDDKLDRVTEIAERMSVVENNHSGFERRLEHLETSSNAVTTEVSFVRGRNSVISWLLGLIGAPLLVIAAGAGLLKMLGLST